MILIQNKVYGYHSYNQISKIMDKEEKLSDLRFDIMQQGLIYSYLEEKLEEVSKKLEELRKEEADLERQIYEELEAEEY